MQVPPRKPDGMLIGYLLHKEELLFDESPWSTLSKAMVIVVVL